MAFCGFSCGARLLDVGCGAGATVEHLRARHGLEAFGLDAAFVSTGSSGHLFRAVAERLPVSSKAMDGVLLECSLSVVEDPDAALGECHRVLRPGGHLVISDMFARGVPARLQGCLGRLETQGELEARVQRQGFTLASFENHSEALLSLWGQLVFERGIQSFCAELGTDAATLRAVRCGYGLLIARKAEP